jgi:antitoxin component YwqK of YwqJK toxin-antitoxin module
MFSGNVANGSAYELYEDGSVKSECTYKKGEIKGKVKEYEQGKKFME